MSDISRLPGAFEQYWAWQLKGACRGVDSSLFFHPPGERGPVHDEREDVAKEICFHCPVRRECAQYALAARERYGVWGGLTEDERQDLVRRSRTAARERARR
ncbi:WhiB family transcriptional regulator [Kitasatospora kazusensis]|uniref:Transcriptional regulator WhiB n=1 Tax=Kitasatospora kazusensis TaxID=407974 RepID=A0ABP5LKW1_9ACTN